jgi:DivIVA domain-containing protein
MANSHTSDSSPKRIRRGAPASELLRDASFPLTVRGYDRRAVDEFLEELRTLVADLEARQTREGVVQKALDELGEETAGILQRAHETADEIAARSRAQADGRLQRAEREAEIVKREADEYADQVVVDTRLLWDERQRLIEDIRHLADVVLGTADDAMERLKLPEPLAAAEQEADQSTGAEVRPIPHPLSIAREPEPEPDLRSDPSVPYDLESPAEDPDRAQKWAVADDEEQDPDTTAGWGAAAADDEDPDTDTSAAWPAEGDEDPDATAPYAFEGGYAADAPEDEEDRDATARWPDEPAADRDEPGEAPADEADAGEDAGHQTVELEALPGGNTDDQAAEPEHKRD